MKSRWRYYAAGALAVLVIVIVVMRILASKGPDDPRRLNIPIVRLEPPRRETVTLSLQFTGDVVAIQQAAIFSKVSGNLERLYTDIGNFVRRGQLLALIDTTELYQQYQQAMATSENNRINYVRSKELYDQNLVAKQDLDNAEAAWKVAAAAFDGAATRLSYARITAPFSGYITKRYLDVGALVTPNSSTLFNLMDLDQMKITISVLEKNISQITVGKKAVITVDAFPGRTFEGTVTRYSDALDLSTRTMAVEIDIPNPDHALKPGMFANVLLIVDQHKDAMTVPTQAILTDDAGAYLFIARQDTARRMYITQGTEQEGRTEILTGIGATDSVIATGQQFVRNGSPIVVQH
jgi:membrane fusion protein (multidrug efflux system)